MNTSLVQLYQRDLNTLKQELLAYPDEALMWKIIPGTKNSGGNLGMHLVGNLKQFIGAILGETGYIRNRPAEFEDKNVQRDQILKEIDETIEVIQTTLPKLTLSEMEKKYPVKVFGHEMTTEYFLFHLLGHLNYHLGQVNYHRRSLMGE